MKKFLVAVALLACAGGVAFAGPNAGGTIFAHDANLVYTVDTADYCGLGTPPSICEGADVNLEGTGDAVQKVWKVYAAFCPNSQPRLKGMTFGVTYDQPVRIVDFGACIGDLNNGAAEIQGPGWPGSNTGTAIVFQNTQTALLVEVYWFAGYSYYSVPAMFGLRAHPDPVLGGVFADDDIPSAQDPIAGYGTMGFDLQGVPACPGPGCDGDPTGACCIGQECTVTTEAECGGTWLGPNFPTCEPNPCLLPTGACCIGEPPDAICVVTDAADCERQGGRYQGDDVPCDPDPCNPPPNPVRESTWGQIKANYR